MNGSRNHKQTFKRTSDDEGNGTSDSGSPKKRKTQKKKSITINFNNSVLSTLIKEAVTRLSIRPATQ